MHRSSLRICRRGANVVVTGDSASVAWVRQRGRRYFHFDASFPNEHEWQIVAGRESAPPLRWSAFERGVLAAPCTFLLNEDHRTIVVDAPPGPWRNLWVLRLVRDLLRWQLFHQGAIFIHASVAAHKGAGLALVGTCRSGKSTLLLQALRSGVFAFVTDDDLTIVRDDAGEPLALGWPGCVRIRRNMLPSFPELIDERSFAHPSNPSEAAGDPRTALLRLFPEEIEERFGCALVPEVPLKRVALLEWRDSPSVTPMPPGDLASALIEAWDILPERRPGVRPDYRSRQQAGWRHCCFNPPLFDIFGIPISLSSQSVDDLATQIAGFSIAHTGDPLSLQEICTSR